jgi:hypothetical protein
MLSERYAIVNLLGPTADYNGSALTSDAVSMENYDELTILLSHKGGTTGKSTLTVVASSDAAATGATAIPYAYRRKTTGASAVWGDISYALAAGIDTVPTEDTIIEIFVRSSELPDGKMFVHLGGAEGVNDPVTGSIVAILGKSRYGGVSQPNVLAA